MLDADGVIIAKFFDEHLGVRANSAELLRAANGETVELVTEAPPADGEVTATITYDGEHLAEIVRHDLVVRLAIPEGQHVYADPAPEGMVPVSIEFDDTDRIGIRRLVAPEPHEHHLDGTDETFVVYDGTVEFRQPLVNTASPRHKTVTVSGTVHWQACDDLACRIPRRERFSFELPTAPSEWPFGDRAEESDATMDFRHHFGRMMVRRSAPDAD
ncbi:MAG: protein-disulfide reductase DsbD family protein [Acidimicrobiales bacterium]|nr:protein-disulfide reductase DsbD family protein [Acidimicrobiales bacterium]